MIKVISEVDIYEVDGSEVVGLNRPKINVLSHWNRPDLVILEIDGKKSTIVATDMEAAITNAKNCSRHF